VNNWAKNRFFKIIKVLPGTKEEREYCIKETKDIVPESWIEKIE
jgi:hypothetical protein